MQRLVLIALAVAAPACEVGPEVDELPDAGADDGPLAVRPTGLGELRVMTYNIRHAADADLAELARIIDAQAPDVVLLQEVDERAARSGNRAQAARLGALTGMEHRFIKAISLRGGGDYGLAILSRFPILGVERLALPSSGEQRIVAVAEIELPEGGAVAVANTHFGLEAGERAEQAAAAAAALDGRAPVVLGGDLNAEPRERAVHETLGARLDDGWSALHAWGGATAPAFIPYRRIDYLYLSRDFPPPRSVRVVGGPAVWFASDHRPVVVTVRLP